MNQFGIQLYGAREPIYIVALVDTLSELQAQLLDSSPLCEVVLVGGGCKKTCLINPQHIVAVSGPNSPRVTELFKR